MKKLDYKWGMLALVSAAYFLAQGTRNVYGAVLPSIGTDLGLSNAARGAVPTVLGRAGEMKELVDVVLFMCSDAASFVTGTNHIVDGGRLCMYQPYVAPKEK